MKFNKHKWKKFALAFLAVACVGMTSACAFAKPKQAPPMKPQNSAWAVYWDWQRGMEQVAVGEGQACVAFAAAFNEQGKLQLPKEFTRESLDALREQAGGKNIYLSIVNDKQEKDSKILLKDTAVLKKILAKKSQRSKHITEIVELAKENGFAGVELDYENIWQDEKLVKDFALLVEELKPVTREVGMKLRVVLEPKTLAYAEKLPADTEYVVMFYNLYGLHSGPGPKANKKFILRTLTQVEKLKGTPNIAFANGGFDWSDGGKTVGITTAQAKCLAQKYNASISRDAESHALRFTYVENGIEHTVWYGDAVTIAYWRSVVEEYGYKRFSLWRLE